MMRPPRRWNVFYAALIGLIIGILLELNLIRLGTVETTQGFIFGVTVFTIIALALCWMRNRMLGF